MLTAEQLQSIMPGLSAKRRGEFLPCLQAAMTEFAIEAPARAAAFLAQRAHESGQFRFMEEIWGPTPAQVRYEPPGSLATTLGNTEAGDGKRFKGRGARGKARTVAAAPKGTSSRPRVKTTAARRSAAALARCTNPGNAAPSTLASS